MAAQIRKARRTLTSTTEQRSLRRSRRSRSATSATCVPEQRATPFLPDDDSYIESNIYVQPQDGKNDIMLYNDKPQLQKRSGYLQYDFMQKLLYKPNANSQHMINFQLSNTNNFNRYDRLSVTEVQRRRAAPRRFAEWYYGPQFRLLAAYHYDGRNQLGADRVHMAVAYQNVKESRHDRKFQKEELTTTGRT